MRRTLLNLKTFMPEWIQYSMCPVDDNTTKANNWFENPYGRKRVEMEANKIIKYVKQGSIMDEIIDISEC